MFASNDLATGLFRIPAAGGEVEVLTTPDAENGELDHLLPEFLPGGNALLFTITNTQGIDNSQIALLDMETGGYRILIPGGSDARYVASGHIVYGVAGTLRAVPFDLDALEVRGTPVPVVDGVVTKRAPVRPASASLRMGRSSTWLVVATPLSEDSSGSTETAAAIRSQPFLQGTTAARDSLPMVGVS